MLRKDPLAYDETMKQLVLITTLLVAIVQPVAAQEWNPTTHEGKFLDKTFKPALKTLIGAALLANSALDKEIPKLEGKAYAVSGNIGLAIKQSANTATHIIEDLVAFTEIYRRVPLGYGIRLKIAPIVLERTKQVDIHLKALTQTHLSLGRAFQQIKAPTLEKANKQLMVGMFKAHEILENLLIFTPK